jgi:ferric-dicitrate binding protein FerR (iron transport regulator)
MVGSPERPRLPATGARQGRWGRHVLWVLIVSVVLSAAALVAVWLWLSGDLARTEHRSGPTEREAAGFHTTPQPSN